MPPLPLPQPVAARYATIAWGVAALAAVGAGVVLMLPKPKVDLAAAATGQGEPAPSKPREPKLPTAGLRQDWDRLKGPFAQLRSPALEEWNKREKERLAALAGQPPTDPNAPSPGGFAPAWRYLGMVVDGTRKSALVFADNKQRFVTEGYTTVDGYRLVSLEPERIVLQQGSSRHVITLTDSGRGKSLTTVMGGMSVQGSPILTPFNAERPKAVVPPAPPQPTMPYPGAVPGSPYPGVPQPGMNPSLPNNAGNPPGSVSAWQAGDRAGGGER